MSYWCSKRLNFYEGFNVITWIVNVLIVVAIDFNCLVFFPHHDLTNQYRQVMHKKIYCNRSIQISDTSGITLIKQLCSQWQQKYRSWKWCGKYEMECADSSYFTPSDWPISKLHVLSSFNWGLVPHLPPTPPPSFPLLFPSPLLQIGAYPGENVRVHISALDQLNNPVSALLRLSNAEGRVSCSSNQVCWPPNSPPMHVLSCFMHPSLVGISQRAIPLPAQPGAVRKVVWRSIRHHCSCYRYQRRSWHSASSDSKTDGRWHGTWGRWLIVSGGGSNRLIFQHWRYMSHLSPRPLPPYKHSQPFRIRFAPTSVHPGRHATLVVFWLNRTHCTTAARAVTLRTQWLPTVWTAPSCSR